jgi:hypothetical protein
MHIGAFVAIMKIGSITKVTRSVARVDFVDRAHTKRACKMGIHDVGNAEQCKSSLAKHDEHYKIIRSC